MAKTGAERMRECRARQKDSGTYGRVKEKDRIRKAKERALLKKTKRGREKLRRTNNEHKRAQRARERVNARSSQRKGFKTTQHTGKCASVSLSSGGRKAQVPARPSLGPSGQLSPKVRQAVTAHYEDDAFSFQSLTHKATRKVEESGEIVDVPVRYLTTTPREAYQMFKLEHPEMRIGRAMFCELRPEHVLLQQTTTHDVATCHIHENIRFLLKALRRSSIKITTEFREFVDLLVCDRESEECMRSDCAACPGLSFLALDESQSRAPCEWTAWVTEKQSVQKTQQGTVLDCVQRLRELVPLFLSHAFTQRAQSKAFEEAIEKVQADEAIIQVDYAENYPCKHQGETSAHWAHQYVAVFTAHVWFRAEDNTDREKSFALVSDYTQHDKYSVHVSLQVLLGEVFAFMSDLRKVVIYSDGAASQFRQNYNMYNITHLANEFGIDIEWNFFESYHAKGAVYAISGAVKKMAWAAAKSGMSITKASEVVSLCKEKETKIVVQEIPPSEILECKEFLNSRWKDIKPMPQLQKVHHVQVVSVGRVMHSTLTNANSTRKRHNFK